MKGQLTRTQAIRLTISVAVLVGISNGLRLLPASEVSADAEWEALHAERESLRDATDAAREEWRKRAASVAEPRWTATQLAEFPRSLPSGWHWRQQSHTGSITRGETPFAQWPQIVALLARLEQTPGLTIVKVELQAAGLGDARRFAGITVEVRIAVQTNGNPERAASLGPLPVSWLVGDLKLAGDRAAAAALAGPRRSRPQAAGFGWRSGAAARPPARQPGLFV